MGRSPVYPPDFVQGDDLPATNPSSNPAPVARPHSMLQQFLLHEHRDRPVPTWIIFPVIYAFVLLTHLRLMRLPCFWDEAGYYIPAAFDYFRTGSLIPYSTLTNAHPPLPAIYLATCLTISGFTPVVTRLATCIVAAFALTSSIRAGAPFDEHHRGRRGRLTLRALYQLWLAQSTPRWRRLISMPPLEPCGHWSTHRRAALPRAEDGLPPLVVLSGRAPRKKPPL